MSLKTALVLALWSMASTVVGSSFSAASMDGVSGNATAFLEQYDQAASPAPVLLLYTKVQNGLGDWVHLREIAMFLVTARRDGFLDPAVSVVVVVQASDPRGALTRKIFDEFGEESLRVWNEENVMIQTSGSGKTEKTNEVIGRGNGRFVSYFTAGSADLTKPGSAAQTSFFDFMGHSFDGANPEQMQLWCMPISSSVDDTMKAFLTGELADALEMQRAGSGNGLGDFPEYGDGLLEKHYRLIPTPVSSSFSSSVVSSQLSDLGGAWSLSRYDGLHVQSYFVNGDLDGPDHVVGGKTSTGLVLDGPDFNMYWASKKLDALETVGLASRVSSAGRENPIDVVDIARRIRLLALKSSNRLDAMTALHFLLLKATAFWHTEYGPPHENTMDVIVTSTFVQEWVKAICDSEEQANVDDVLSEALTDFYQNLFGNSVPVEFIVRVFKGTGTPSAENLTLPEEASPGEESLGAAVERRYIRLWTGLPRINDDAQYRSLSYPYNDALAPGDDAWSTALTLGQSQAPMAGFCSKFETFSRTMANRWSQKNLRIGQLWTELKTAHGELKMEDSISEIFAGDVDVNGGIPAISIMQEQWRVEREAMLRGRSFWSVFATRLHEMGVFREL